MADREEAKPENMSFMDALALMRQGRCVALVGWNDTLLYMSGRFEVNVIRRDGRCYGFRFEEHVMRASGWRTVPESVARKYFTLAKKHGYIFDAGSLTLHQVTKKLEARVRHAARH